MQYRTITDGLLFPEGPIAMPDGTVLVVEIARGHPDPGVSRRSQGNRGRDRRRPQRGGHRPDGKCYICNNGGFKWKVEPNGKPPLDRTVRRLRQRTHRARGRRQRNGRGALRLLRRAAAQGSERHRLRSRGGFWFTDLGKVREREIDRGGVYYARTDGSLIREVVHPFLTANGVGLSPDEKTLYVARPKALDCGHIPSSARVRWRWSLSHRH